ncbi:hypothetical protein [Pseudodonghicola flavimaris]|uniref:Uncharacterized protein n=1 Tax=Pseudodonghicola flavimaris TaxID=3050036 RepID=A0ABT7F5D6_9RHOB|nr:hypothetical protein [Pseudodonghicola flavimaris]MDK3019822.1 hypothetical protein [Pseudodonghicola flavimaris]
MVGYGLILLTLLAAVIGTLTEADRRIKLSLISVAVLSAGVSLWMTFQDNREKILNQRLIASLVQSSQDETIFAEELRMAINAIVAPTGRVMTGLTFSSAGMRLVFGAPDSGVAVGAVFLGERDLRPVRYALIAETDLEPVLRPLLIEDIWQDDTLAADWNRIAPKIGYLVQGEIDGLVPLGSGETLITFPEGGAVAVAVPHPIHDRMIVVTLTKDDLAALVGLAPIERGARISDLVAEQVVAAL